VVLSVARLFYHLAPASQAEKVAKPLVRILRNHREQQYVVLNNIATMSLRRPVSIPCHVIGSKREWPLTDSFDLYIVSL
jgi:hypothetical protein